MIVCHCLLSELGLESGRVVFLEQLPCGIGGDRLIGIGNGRHLTGTTTVCTIKMGQVDDEAKEVVQGILTSIVTIERELDVPLARDGSRGRYKG